MQIHAILVTTVQGTGHYAPYDPGPRRVKQVSCAALLAGGNILEKSARSDTSPDAVKIKTWDSDSATHSLWKTNTHNSLK